MAKRRKDRLDEFFTIYTEREGEDWWGDCYDTQLEAVNEASSRAERNPGNDYYVMRSVRVVRAPVGAVVECTGGR